MINFRKYIPGFLRRKLDQQGGVMEEYWAYLQVRHLHLINGLWDIRKIMKIDVGGYSDVFRGTMVRKKKKDVTEIAIKEIRRTLTDNAEHNAHLCGRFYREVFLWDSLNHDNIVKLLGFTTPRPNSNESPCLIMPWYASGNVLAYLMQNPHINRLLILKDVVSGLRYLHSEGVVHGDLKGLNVLINDSGIAMLSDFGASQFDDDMHQIIGVTTSEPAGTTRFSCPELQNNQVKNQMTDMWAFGCLAMEVLSGLTPYGTLAGNALSNAIRAGESPYDMENYEPRNSQEAAILPHIMRCWSFDPTSRPTAGQFGDQLDSIIFNWQN
ncbi:hypothetical protein FRC03_008365 [Tulasnella sp. 419]|nr:hypothetical protein FRC03_008365 [Tulasnella sp. 419]